MEKVRKFHHWLITLNLFWTLICAFRENRLYKLTQGRNIPSSQDSVFINLIAWDKITYLSHVARDSVLRNLEILSLEKFYFKLFQIADFFRKFTKFSKFSRFFNFLNNKLNYQSVGSLYWTIKLTIKDKKLIKARCPRVSFAKSMSVLRYLTLI